MKDLTLFGRRVSGGRTMGEGADMACQSVISKLTMCKARNEGKAGACSRSLSKSWSTCTSEQKGTIVAFQRCQKMISPAD